MKPGSPLVLCFVKLRTEEDPETAEKGGKWKDLLLFSVVSVSSVLMKNKISGEESPEEKEELCTRVMSWK